MRQKAGFAIKRILRGVDSIFLFRCGFIFPDPLTALVGQFRGVFFTEQSKKPFCVGRTRPPQGDFPIYRTIFNVFCINVDYDRFIPNQRQIHTHNNLYQIGDRNTREVITTRSKKEKGEELRQKHTRKLTTFIDFLS